MFSCLVKKGATMKTEYKIHVKWNLILSAIGHFVGLADYMLSHSVWAAIEMGKGDASFATVTVYVLWNFCLFSTCLVCTINFMDKSIARNSLVWQKWVRTFGWACFQLTVTVTVVHNWPVRTGFPERNLNKS